MSYSAQTALKPRGLKGISDKQIDQHWALYEGYVKNTNDLLGELAKAEVGSRHWSELKRRAGFEFNGMILHEFYFGNLASGLALKPQGPLGTALAGKWNSLDAWREDFVKTGLMRGIGWAILYHDPQTGQIFNWWISDHELHHPAGFNPILVLDVWEHAYMVDHGAGGRADYIKAFFDNVNWDLVERRLEDSKARKSVSRFPL